MTPRADRDGLRLRVAVRIPQEPPRPLGRQRRAQDVVRHAHVGEDVMQALGRTPGPPDRKHERRPGRRRAIRT